MEGRRVSPLHISPGRDQLHPRFPSAVLGQIPQQGREHRGAGWPRPPGIGRYAGSRSFGATRENGRSLQTPRPAPPSGASIPPPGEGPLPAHHSYRAMSCFSRATGFCTPSWTRTLWRYRALLRPPGRRTRSPAWKTSRSSRGRARMCSFR